MNEKELYYSPPKYNVGELIKIRQTSDLAIIIETHCELLNKHDAISGDSDLCFMYKLHFCGEDEPDSRWVPEYALQFI